MSKPRVRFAPSPTGALHIGGVRTALYNYLYAKKLGGTFILRIEDTDQTRYVPGAEDYIMEALAWCGLEMDESPAKGGEYGPYRQSERKEMYGDFGHQLVKNGWGYYAFDTSEDLDVKREELEAQGQKFSYSALTRGSMKNSLTMPADEVKQLMDSGVDFTIRLKCPADEVVSVDDIVRERVEFQSGLLDDKVMLKSDGMPTYHLANVVDDYHMKITHVIRGEEWLPSTAHHVLLYRAFGWEDSMPQFAHLPLILKPAPSSYINNKNVDSLTEKFVSEFYKKNPDFTLKSKEQVKQMIRGILIDKNSISSRVQVKGKDKEDKIVIKEFLKSTLFGKLSKRDGDRLGFPVFPLSWQGEKADDSFEGFKTKGFDPKALINFLAFLGWNPGTEQEIFSMDELVDTFTLERIGKSGAKFDYEKSKWYNQQYLINGDNATIAKDLKPLMVAKGWNVDDATLEKVAELYKQRVTFLNDIPAAASYFFVDDFSYDEKTARKKWKSQHAEKNYALVDILENTADFSAENLETVIKGFITENELGFGDVMAPLRIAISGVGGGPSLFDILALLGKEKSVERLRKGYVVFEGLQS
jgi:nondiscriminating glutamyl-tRNA synthetase